MQIICELLSQFDRDPIKKSSSVAIFSLYPSSLLDNTNTQAMEEMQFMHAVSCPLSLTSRSSPSLSLSLLLTHLSPILSRSPPPLRTAPLPFFPSSVPTRSLYRNESLSRRFSERDGGRKSQPYIRCGRPCTIYECHRNCFQQCVSLSLAVLSLPLTMCSEKLSLSHSLPFSLSLSPFPSSSHFPIPHRPLSLSLHHLFDFFFHTQTSGTFEQS